MKIIIDAMSGDKAPAEIVKGALDARAEFGADILLVGAEDVIKTHLPSQIVSGVEIAHAGDVIGMHDDPSTAVRRKKDSSMAVALRLLSEGEGDAVVSAGNTGALLTGATLIVKRIRGIRRAAMAPVIPNGGTGAVLIDCGANAECTPEYLLQFAYMGAFYAMRVLGIKSPRVALLNNGAEESKGTALQKLTYALLTEAASEGRVNFIGNAEAGEIFAGKADVIVTDGFSGNIMLKSIEGTAGFLMREIKRAFTSSAKSKLGAVLLKNELTGLKAMLDPSEVGGTALLGISKPVIKAHGSSDARAIRSAVSQAVSVCGSGIISDIEKNIQFMQVGKESEGTSANE